MCVVNDGVLSQVSVMCACVYVILALAYTARSVTLQQVRRPLVRPKSIPSPTELEALFLVCTSTPLVPLDSAPGRRGNRSDCLVVAQACLLVVHYKQLDFSKIISIHVVYERSTEKVVYYDVKWVEYKTKCFKV